MSCTDAIRDAFTHYATVSGRSSRSAYDGPNPWGYGPDGRGPTPPAFAPTFAAGSRSVPPPS